MRYRADIAAVAAAEMWDRETEAELNQVEAEKDILVGYNKVQTC